MSRTHKRSWFFAAVVVAVVMLMVSLSVSTLHAQMGGGGMGGGMGTGQGDLAKGMSGMMVVSGGNAYRHDDTPLKMEDAINLATSYVNALGIGFLPLDEVEEWEFNYYVVIQEPAPSQYKAFQLIIDKWTGFVMPEPGPNMMWNQKYGRMMNNMSDGMGGGMRKRDQRMTDPNMTITSQAAASAATQFLRERFSRSLAVDGEPDVYYGYYNFDVNDGVTGAKYGMLSVNGTTGQVWYHTWHGNYVQGRELN